MSRNPYTSPESDPVTTEKVLTKKTTMTEVLFSFEGRIGRSEFWLGMLIVIFSPALLGMLPDAVRASGEMGFIDTIFSVFILWISLAVQIKRWHDRGKSGWWVLIGLIPLIGFFWILIENGMLSGDKGVNIHGMPKRL